MRVVNKDLLNKINTLDLSPIKGYLVKHFNWSRNAVDELGAEYRRFLFLIGKYGPDAIVPWNRNVMAFWKVHILHTRKYFEDCQNVLGFYLHYDPSVSGLFRKGVLKDGSNVTPAEQMGLSQADAPALLSKTIDLYTKEYNKSPLG